MLLCHNVLSQTIHTLIILCAIFLPFFGKPRPFPYLDFLSSSLLLGLAGATGVPLTASPLSLRESPLPESLEEVFLSLRLALAFRRASWMLLLDDNNQLPLISIKFRHPGTDPPLSSSADAKSLRSTSSVEKTKKTVSCCCILILPLGLCYNQFCKEYF